MRSFGLCLACSWDPSLGLKHLQHKWVIGCNSHPLSIGMPLVETHQDQLESRSPSCVHVDCPAYWTHAPLFVHGDDRQTSSASAIPTATRLSLRVTFLT